MRDWIFLECTECGTRYYRTSKNTKTNPKKIELSKFCKSCHGHKLHKERKK